MNGVGWFFGGLLVGIILTLVVIIIVANTVPLTSPSSTPVQASAPYIYQTPSPTVSPARLS